MEENKYIVYKHTSPSGKVYIGMTKQSANGRWKNGLGYKSSPHFWNAIQKYGWENFEHEILFEGLLRDEACAKEKELIALFKSLDPLFGYNQKTGGELGSQLNEDSLKKLSNSCKRFYKEHPEVAKRIAAKNKGYRHTDEAKAKMSEAAKNRHYVLSDEWKRKIGDANKARLLSDENLYKETCERCRANGAKAAKAVVQLTIYGEYVASFSNAHEAERNTGIGNGNIGSCCRGIAKTAGGYKWRYANEYNGGRETA